MKISRILLISAICIISARSDAAWIRLRIAHENQQNGGPSKFERNKPNVIYCVFENTSGRDVSIIRPVESLASSCFSIKLVDINNSVFRIPAKTTLYSGGFSKIPEVSFCHISDGRIGVVKLVIGNSTWPLNEIKSGVYKMIVSYDPKDYSEFSLSVSNPFRWDYQPLKNSLISRIDSDALSIEF